MVSDQDAQILTDLTDTLNQAATTLLNLQKGMAPDDPDNDVVSHLIGTLTQQSFTLQNNAIALALAVQGNALTSVKAAMGYLKSQAALMADINTAVSVVGGLAGLAAAIIAHDPGGTLTAASTLIGLIGGAKASAKP